jgi:hypothetical protein
MTIKRGFLAGDAAAAASAAKEDVLCSITTRSLERGREEATEGSGIRGTGGDRTRLLRRMGQATRTATRGGWLEKVEPDAHGGLCCALLICGAGDASSMPRHTQRLFLQM